MVILGYPPVPLSTSNHLLAVRAEINAIINVMHSKGVHFIASAVPRGGFSGGLALSEFGFALGIVTHSLVRDGAPAETGFFTVMSIEPLYECLAHHRMLPEQQKSGWDGFWNTASIDYTRSADGTGLVVASIGYYDDERTIYIDCHAHKESALTEEIVSIVLSTIGDHSVGVDRKRDDWVRVTLGGHTSEAQQLSAAAVEAVDASLQAKGLRARPFFSPSDLPQQGQRMRSHR